MKPESAIEERLASPGYTPGRRDVEPLLQLLESASDDVAKRIERALSRLGSSVGSTVAARFPSTKAPGRARLVSLAGRVFGLTQDALLRHFLEARLFDAEPLAKRRAITALGKTSLADLEGPLLSCWTTDLAPPETRAVVVALGNVGGEASLARLSTLRAESTELARVVREARLKIERRLLRTERSEISGTRRFPRPVSVLLHVRRGLEELLCDELGIEVHPRLAGPGRVQVVSALPLHDLFVARTFLHLGLALPPEPVEGDDVAAAVARALTSDVAWEILSTVTRGTIRYRLEWAGAGRSRAATFRVAEQVALARPALVNDATSAPWEAVVSEGEGRSGRRVYVELWPRALPDPRFSYRRRTLPASSHPTLAAALARISDPGAGDAVWDPFVGSGIELCECSLLAPSARLLGTDTDGEALCCARENLSAARASRVELAVADARSFTPKVSPTLIVTNPPFGRRVLGRAEIPALFDAFLANVARVLAPGGRLVWVSPLGEGTASLAARHGLRVRARRGVDVGGIPGEIQVIARGMPTR